MIGTSSSLRIRQFENPFACPKRGSHNGALWTDISSLRDGQIIGSDDGHRWCGIGAGQILDPVNK